MRKVIALLAGLLLAAAAFSQDSRITVTVELLGTNYMFKEVAGSYMGVTEVTQAQYEAVMGENPSKFKGGNLPVEQVSWYDAIYFCNKLSLAANYSPVYAVDGVTDVAKWGYTPHKGDRIAGAITQNENATGFRLPTDDEWEYAAWGGQSYRYAGSDDLDEVGWYSVNSGGSTHPVAQKKANGYGLYDMSGNVWEWVWDSYWKDPVRRFFRGGCWYYGNLNCSPVNTFSNKTYYYAYYGGEFIGFRIVLSGFNN